MTDKKKALIIDDDQTVHSVLKFILEKIGFHVFAARDAMQGITMLTQFQPDFITLDIGLPAGGGFTIYNRLKGLKETAGIPILIYSAHLSKEEIEKKIAKSANTRFLPKPSSPEKIISAIHQLCPPA